MAIDINCDTGESIGNDEELMQFITSANIACGYHAGDEQTMRTTLLLAKQYGVAAGAHPSYMDREHFGRTEMDCTPQEVYGLVVHQVAALEEVAKECGMVLHHVKPHGALYNKAARDQELAAAIAKAVRDCNPALMLYGLSGSFLISEGKAAGLSTRSEVFADRTYSDDASLTPRSEPNALITDVEQAVQQVEEMVREGVVTSVNGVRVPIVAETVCIHGDGPMAVEIAKAIKERFTNR
ncbi:MAG TPA: 5-oxoprolinase subunit PxpA [Chitinophagaceae bacterium]